MNVLIVNTSDCTGGAAVAANRLVAALNRNGVYANMLVRDRLSADSNVYAVKSTIRNRLYFLWERLIIFLSNKLDRKQLFRVSIANTGVDISNHELVKNADIIHLHWINQGFLSLDGIKGLIATGKPIVWTMHDMWPCTSICHHAHDCSGYMKECGACPFLNSQNKNDLSHRTWRKKQFLQNSEIQLVAVSSWLQKLSQQSSLTNSVPCAVIPNVINNNIFFPSDKSQARKKLNIPLTKRVILMGAARLDDPIKGLNYLLEALELMSQEARNNICVLFLGQIKDNSSFLSELSVAFVHLGLINDIHQIVNCYQAADVVVVPSLYETFGQTIIEAMACGCPAVSFDNSGQTDIIDHQVNGYLAEYKNAADLANGIEWVLNHPNKKELADASVTKVQTHYAEPVVARQYIKLYTSLLKK